MSEHPDTIFLEDLHVVCTIGVHDWERRSRQTLLVSFELSTDTQQAARTDSLDATIDYAEASAAISAIARKGHFKVIEALAESIAQWLLESFPTSKVIVKIRKPAALSQAESVGVRIVRTH
jgi:dihydroneopterin aldolase